jgi:hypothetical protein
MENLSHLLAPDPLAPTSQHSGAQTDNSAALPGPGSGPDPVRPVPVLDMIDHGATTTSPEGQPSPEPWTSVNGRPWAAAADISAPGKWAEQ